MKTLNYKMEQMYFDALAEVQAYYSRTSGVKVSQSQALRRLLYEAGQQVKNTGKLWEKGGNGNLEE